MSEEQVTFSKAILHLTIYVSYHSAEIDCTVVFSRARFPNSLMLAHISWIKKTVIFVKVNSMCQLCFKIFPIMRISRVDSFSVGAKGCV